jgi:hypothetical protein
MANPAPKKSPLLPEMWSKADRWEYCFQIHVDYLTLSKYAGCSPAMTQHGIFCLAIRLSARDPSHNLACISPTTFLISITRVGFQGAANWPIWHSCSSTHRSNHDLIRANVFVLPVEPEARLLLCWSLYYFLHLVMSSLSLIPLRWSTAKGPIKVAPPTFALLNWRL